MKLCLVAMLLCLSKTESIHPYNILGVRSSDSQAKIKSAYKNLARQWHPDKNKSPDAAKKMMEINEAYEILSDPERKTQFDMYGTTDEQSNRASHFHHESRRGPDQHFSFMFEDMPFGSRHRWKRKNVLTRYAYNNIVLPDSHHKLFLIAVFEEMSFECMKLFPLWEKLTTNLENIGIGTYEMHFSEDPRLAHDLGVNWWPGFVAIVGGRPIKYKDYEKSERVIRDFLATVLPHDNIDHINSETAKEYFEKSFHDNKPQCLLFSKHMFPPLLFLSVAYEYRSKVKFFYVDVKDPGTERLREKYEVSKSDPTIVMLKEEPSDPVEIVRGNALRRGKLRELIAQNLYFHVPRLSSPKLFEDLCPKKYAADRWFCMVVVYEKNSNFSKSLWKFRQISKEERLSNKRFRFLYVYEDVQTSLMNDLNVDQQTKPLLCNDGRPAAKLVTLQRGGTGRIRYSWFPGGWCVDSRLALLRYIGQLDAGEEVLEHETQSVHIVDELQHGYLWSFVKRTYKFVQHINDSLEHPSWSNVTSIFFVLLVVFGLTIGCIIPLLTDYFWDTDDTTELPRHRKPPTSTCVLGLEKLYDKTQKTLINNAERGQICVAVVLDVSAIEDVAMSPIAQAFSDAIYNFTSDPQFKFTWVSLPEQLLWCTEVMQIKKFGEFLPGTVIAMNGFRKYSYKFRPNIGGEDQPQISAKFVGFESSDDESDGYAHLERVKSKRAALRLRSDLPAWLERLLDGTLLKDKTKHVEWPTMEVT